MKESLTRWFKISDRDEQKMLEIPVKQIYPSPYQPRTVFDPKKIDELCQTIRTHGVIQPIVVRKTTEGFELIAGERRWRAVQKLKLESIPAIIKDMSDSQAASASLIENLQREELTAIEEAHAFQRLIAFHQLTQESLAQRLGKGQSTIANKLRLLQLPAEIQEALFQRKITERHARAILSLSEKNLQLQLLEEILSKKLNVKQTEERIRQMKKKASKLPKPNRKAVSKDTRIAMNTIRKSIQMVEESGIEIETEEKEKGIYMEVTIRIKK